MYSRYLVKILLDVLLTTSVICSQNNTTTGEVFENKMSDVVKGTARPSSASKDIKVSTPTVAASMPCGTTPATAAPSHPPLSSIHIVPPKAKCHTPVMAEKKPVATGAVATTAATKTVANDRLASPTVQSSHSRQKYVWVLPHFYCILKNSHQVAVLLNYVDKVMCSVHIFIEHNVISRFVKGVYLLTFWINVQRCWHCDEV